jgi:hypothetical protein
VAGRLISEPEGLSEAADCAWEDDDGESLSDFGRQSGGGECGGLTYDRLSNRETDSLIGR